MNQSPEDIARDRIRMEERVLEPAQEPANVTRPKQSQDKAMLLSDFPIRLIPRMEVYLGAVANTVNEVVEEVKVLEIDGSENTVNLFLPLSRKKGGIAVEPLDSVFRFMGDLAQQQYLIVAADEQAATSRVESLVQTIHEKLSSSFGGELIEQENSPFSIDRADMFKTTVGLDYQQVNAVDSQTVNEVHVIVSVYIHVADLVNMDNGESFNKRYKAYIRNAAAATGVPTSLAVAFDVSNFLLRPNILSLFTSLLTDETVKAHSVEAVNGGKHLPIDVNTVISVELSK
jgi:hypothetical protein